MKITKRHTVDSIPLEQSGGTFIYTSFASLFETMSKHNLLPLNPGEVVTEIVIENKGVSLKIEKEAK